MLALTAGMKEFLELLLKTPYSEDAKQEKGASAMELERRFNRRFLLRLQRILEACPEDLSEFLRIYFLTKLEIANLKCVLRGRASKLPATEVKELLIPLEGQSPIDFDHLLAIEDAEDFSRVLEGTPYAAVTYSPELGQEHSALWPVEVKLNYILRDRVYSALSRIPYLDRNPAMNSVEIETDVENLLLAQGWKRAEQSLPDPEAIFQHAYGFSTDVLKQLAKTGDFARTMESVAPIYASILRPVAKGDLSLVKTYLRREIYEMSGRRKKANDFGFPCLLSYLVSCEIEKADLTAIAWGKERGIDSEKIVTYSVLPFYSP